MESALTEAGRPCHGRLNTVLYKCKAYNNCPASHIYIRYMQHGIYSVCT